MRKVRSLIKVVVSKIWVSKRCGSRKKDVGLKKGDVWVSHL